MTYASLMVHVELGHSNAGLLQITGDLAERFNSSVIGIAAYQPLQILYGEGFVCGDVVAQDLKELERETREAEAEFRSALRGHVAALEWRSTLMFSSLSDYLVSEARSTDLVITGVAADALLDTSRRVNIGDLVMQVGRPIIIVPAGASKLKLDRVVIGWKDTREARRAAFDALPLLKKAGHVVVVEIAAEEKLVAARAHLEDVVGWLKRHGIDAESLVSHSTGDDTSGLYAIARDQGADILVAGAYGHRRLREWALGGVTRDLLLRTDCCALISH